MASTSFTTKSGQPLKIGTGTGTSWQWLKKGRPESEQNDLLQELVDQIATSLENGFRHIDTAEQYTTHPEVAAGIKKSGIAREDIWLTTKYAPGFLNVPAPSKSPAESIDKALAELETDYLDLFLIHAPWLTPELLHGYDIESAWKELIDAKKAGKVRHIGVSNFAWPHLERTFAAAGGDKQFYPEVNQIEFHPYLKDQLYHINEFCKKHNILVEAFAPLAPLWRVKDGDKEIVDHPLTKILPGLAEKYGKTEAQILLRYTLQKDILPITTSSKPQRIRESLAVYEFELDPSDVALIDAEGDKLNFRGFFGDAYDEYETEESKKLYASAK